MENTTGTGFVHIAPGHGMEDYNLGLQNGLPIYSPVDDDGVWLDSWRGKQPLPKLVRLRIGFPAGDARRWPELIVSPRITDDANCAFDVVAQRCRSGAS
mgnify:CR=1 FL=1